MIHERTWAGKPRHCTRLGPIRQLSRYEQTFATWLVLLVLTLKQLMSAVIIITYSTEMSVCGAKSNMDRAGPTYMLYTKLFYSSIPGISQMRKLGG